MKSFVSAPSLPKIAMVVFGVALGVLDVRQAREALDRAMEQRTARAIGQRMVIADPWFVVKVWGERLRACTTSVWCTVTPIATPYAPRAATTTEDPAVRACLDSLTASPDSASGRTPTMGTMTTAYLDCMTRGSGGSTSLRPLSRQEPSPSAVTTTASGTGAWWARLWPVVLVRVTILPVAQTGWALLTRGWTARIVFSLSLIAAFFLALRAARGADSIPGALLFAVLSFLAASVVLSFGFNLLLRAGNAVAGYWGVLFALASGIYVMIELAGKLSELANLTGAGRR